MTYGDEPPVHINDLVEATPQAVSAGIAAWYRLDRDYSVAEAALHAERIRMYEDPIVSADLARAIMNRNFPR